jgi:hypothetical protein
MLLSMPMSLWAKTVTKTWSSRAEIEAYGPLDAYFPPGDEAWDDPAASVKTWIHPDWPPIEGAEWISTAESSEEPVSDTWRWFHDTLKLPCTALSAGTEGTIEVTSDNAEELYLNGELVGTDGEVKGAAVDDNAWSTVLSYPVALEPGENSLDFVVRDYGLEGGTPETNPTGLIYSVTYNYTIPEVLWRPPITTSAHPILKNGRTLPIKFKLINEDGTPITERQDIYLTIQGPGDSDQVIARFNPGFGCRSLRFCPRSYQYHANFKTKRHFLRNGATYTVYVHDGCTDEVLGSKEFTVEKKKGNGKPKKDHKGKDNKGKDHKGKGKGHKK